jgi:D-psicose/D-tagatose/L-ribulose 3-epimerase
MRFGVNTLIWSAAVDRSIPFEAIKAAGADGVEVPVFDSSTLDVGFLKKMLADHALACTFCSVNPAGKNPISEDASVRAATFEHWKKLIDAAGEAGAELIAGPTYAPVGYLPGRRRNRDEWEWGVDFHQRLDPLLAGANVQMAVEPINRFETYFLNTAAGAVKFVEEIASPRIGVLLDTFHANIEEKSVPDAYRLCGKWLRHVHTCENDRGIPGTGHVDWRGVFQALRDIGYDGWLTIESFNGMIAELAAATAIWRDLAPSQDDIAFRGTAFLKKTWASM